MTSSTPEHDRRSRLDHTKHEQFIENNRAKIRRDKRKRLRKKIRRLEDARKEMPANKDLRRELKETKEKLEALR